MQGKYIWGFALIKINEKLSYNKESSIYLLCIIMYMRRQKNELFVQWEASLRKLGGENTNE